MGQRGALQGAAQRKPAVPQQYIGLGVPPGSPDETRDIFFWEVNTAPRSLWRIGESHRLANTSSSPTSCTSWCGLTLLDKARFALTTAQPHGRAVAPWADGL